MKKRSIQCGLLALALSSSFAHSQVLQEFELENGALLGALLGAFAGLIDEPFEGVGVYGNSDGVSAVAALSGIPGVFALTVTGASSNDSTARVGVYLGDKRLGTPGFSGTVATSQTLEFELTQAPSESELRFVLETDDGSNDTFLDAFTLARTGDIPPPPPPPILPAQGAFESQQYRNLFVEMGLSPEEVEVRVNAVYNQLFHSEDLENEALFIPVGEDMAYIWDTGNNDVRSEGMSYGMMMAVLMGRKEDFDRLWKWANTYSLNREGDMKGYYAWQVTTDGQVRDKNPAPDGEEYMATALFFASHRWGDGEDLFDYNKQANILLDDMFDNGQTRYANGGVLESFSLFDHDEMQVVFSPATPSDRNWTDPSYHLPAFYELWARWADSNNAFWLELAQSSRDFLKTTVHPDTGLSPDYAYFDGTAHGDFQHWKDTFQYDAWRTVGNAAMDYYWWKKDEWQSTYAETLQAFFMSEGIDSYSSLYELDGTPYENNADHSPGLVAMNALASLASNEPAAWEFVEAFWKTPIPTGKYRYYDGCLYMFAMLALSGKYQIYCPNCESSSSSANSSLMTSSSSDRSSSVGNSSVSSSSADSSSGEQVSSASSSQGSILGGGIGINLGLMLCGLLAFRLYGKRKVNASRGAAGFSRYYLWLGHI